MLPDEVERAIEAWGSERVSPAAARFARQVVRSSAPPAPARARALLYAASRLGAFGEAVGLELVPEVLLAPSVIERFALVDLPSAGAATRRTVRSNLRALAASLAPSPGRPRFPRERSKPPYSASEIAAYLALADAQPTGDRRARASALICLGAGAGLVGADLKALRGGDVVERSGAVVLEVRSGHHPRAVPVLARYHRRLLDVAAWAGARLLIGGSSPARRNVTSPLTASLAGGADLPRVELGRLRSTWLCEVARGIGLRAFMDAAGIACSQRLGDLVAGLEAPGDEEALRLLGARP